MSVSMDKFAHHIFSRFRWVFCQLETLRRSVNRNLRGILEKLPRTLDETYERVLNDIDEDNRDHARRLLHCIAVAIRPLYVEELAEILAFDFDGAVGGIPKFRADWRSKDQEWAVLSTCSSLVTVVDAVDYLGDKYRVVQFSHFSVKEFLISDRLASSAGDVSRYHILPGSAHIILVQARLGFLLHLDTSIDEETGEHSPLARYAAEHWVAHAQFEDVASYVKDGMYSLFDPDKHHFVAWARTFDIDGYSPPTSNPLYHAALCGFHDLVEHLVISHPQLINTVCGFYDSPLLAALSGNHIQVAEFLLGHGGNVDIQGEEGLTPLQMSIHPDIFNPADINVVLFLLRHGANVNFPGSDHSTPLHLATSYAYFDIVQLLLEKGADVDSRDDKGRTPLHMLQSYDEEEAEGPDITRLLLERGANVNAKDKDGAMPLLNAAYKGYVCITQILLEHAAELNAKNSDYQTTLHLLLTGEWFHSENSDPCGLARLLLKHGANVNDKDKDHMTPLHLAMTGQWYDKGMAQILLEHNAQPNAVNKAGQTPLHLALNPEYFSRHGLDDTDIFPFGLVRLLLEHGADVNAQDKYNTTPLFLATHEGMYDLTRILLSRGAEPNVKDGDGKTPLHLLSEGVYFSNSDEDDIPDLARLLLDHGADVNARDKNHATPLLFAAEEHLDDIAQILLERGADPNVKNTKGKTPLHLLLQRSFRDHDDINDVLVVERLLLDRGADVNAQDEGNTTPLYLACCHRRFEIGQIILDRFNAEKDLHPAQSCITLEGEYDSRKKVSMIHGFH